MGGWGDVQMSKCADVQMRRCADGPYNLQLSTFNSLLTTFNIQLKKMKTQVKQQGIGDRLKAPTPKFFQRVRNIGLLLGAIGGAILTAPVSLPATVITVAGYLTTAGLVASAVSSVAVKEDGGE